jgi:hypothetical protein
MPTHYRIQIKERLDLHWAAWFEDMRFTHTESGTILEGALADPAALYGLIGKLRDLGLTLIAVNAVDTEHSI